MVREYKQEANGAAGTSAQEKQQLLANQPWLLQPAK
jgi:hypothetical protein